MNIKETVIHILTTSLKQYRRNCPQDITDLVFLEIENNFMENYEKSVNYRGQDQTNKLMGKTIREFWDLKNLGRCKSPRSRLISSYELHSN